jgi:hypothetical protein
MNFRWLMLLTLLCTFPTGASEGPPMEVTVQVEGNHALVDGRLVLPVSRQQAWAVMTDFDHMARFLSNMRESRVLSVDGNTLTTFQRGLAKFGLVSFSFELTREIKLTPLEKIQTHLISGSTMKKLDSITTLQEENGQLWLVYHSDSIISTWMPALVAKPFIEHETREQFGQMREEMIRRKSNVDSNRL